MKVKRKYIKGFCLMLFVVALSVNAFGEVLDKVIVVINDEVITQREFERAFTPMSKQLEANFSGEELEAETEKTRKMFLEQLINAKLTVSIAKKMKVEIDEADLEERISKIKGFYESEAAFLYALNEKGTNLTELEQEVRNQLLSQKLIEQEISAKIVITPSALHDLFEENRKQFISRKRVKLKSIMIRKEEGLKQGNPQSKIEKIMIELETGKDFSELAMEKSEGPYKEKGGEMGYVVQGQLIPVMDEVVSNLKKGEFSKIIETEFGYHILYAEDIEEPRDMDFNEVSGFLREQLFMNKFKVKLDEWLGDKRKDAYISYK